MPPRRRTPPTTVRNTQHSTRGISTLGQIKRYSEAEGTEKYYYYGVEAEILCICLHTRSNGKPQARYLKQTLAISDKLSANTLSSRYPNASTGPPRQRSYGVVITFTPRLRDPHLNLCDGAPGVSVVVPLIFSVRFQDSCGQCFLSGKSNLRVSVFIMREIHQVYYTTGESTTLPTTLRGSRQLYYTALFYYTAGIITGPLALFHILFYLQNPYSVIDE